MPFRKSYSGSFTTMHLTANKMQIRGIFILKNNRNEIINFYAAEDTISEIYKLFYSNDYIWRYNPIRFEIEEVSSFKDLDFRFAQLQRELPTLMQQDVDMVSEW